MRRPPRSGSAWASKCLCKQVLYQPGNVCQLAHCTRWRQVAAGPRRMPGCCCSAVATKCLHGRALVTTHALV